MAKYKVTFQIQADMTIDVEAPDNASFSDVLSLVKEEHVWDAEVNHNSDVARETLEALKYEDHPDLYFFITDENFEPVES